MEKINKQKYLKYKQKYLNLKELKNIKGGMGYYTKYWNEHPDFITINNSNESNLILNSTYNSVSQYSKYKPDLDMLLQMNQESGVINLDFLTNFFRKIYYDVPKPGNASKYAIRITLDPVNGKKKAEWITPDQNKYSIERTIVQPHQNTTILFLRNKTDSSDEKVLKIFNKIPSSFNTIKDYLSLEIIHITNNISMFDLAQNNYFKIKPEDFKYINFNMQTNLISTQEEELILLASPNNDAINDYINNLILQQINTKSAFNFVKYDNLFVTQIESEGIKTPCYCILMEKLDGSISEYFKTDNFITTYGDPKDDKPEKLVERKEIVTKILTDSERILKRLKTPEYLFTHTDMKIENLFYKLEGNTPIVYLADFDKASISYHNIRFYNDVRQHPNFSFIGKKIADKYSFLNPFVKTDSYTIREYEKRVVAYHDNTPYEFRISRIGKNLSNFLYFIKSPNIEFEELYMRYNYTPYYINFDMVSLILSIINTKVIGGAKPDPSETPELYKIITDYIIDNPSGSYNILEILFSTYYMQEPINGNFGQLLNSLVRIREDQEVNMFKQSIQNNDYLYINKLFLSESNKIALSIPFKPELRQRSIIDGNKELSVIILDAEQNLYSLDEIGNRISLINKLKTFASKRVDNFVLDYSLDYRAGAGSLISPKNNIIKTNRYSFTKFFVTLVYDWDNFDERKKQIILDLFNSVSSYQARLS